MSISLVPTVNTSHCDDDNDDDDDDVDVLRYI